MPTRTSLSIVVVLTLATFCAAEEKQKTKKAKATKRITVGKQTTYVTGPLRDDGTVDFAKAINAHFGKGVTPDKNANVLYWRALGQRPERSDVSDEMFRLLGMKRPAKNAETLQDIVQLARKTGRNHKDAMKQMELAMARPWTRKQYPVVAEWLEKNQSPLKTIIQGTRRPHYFQPLIADREHGLLGALLPSVQSLRTAGRALVARAMLRLGEGKEQEAWADLQATHRLGRHISHGSTLIESLVGIAIDGIANTGDAAFFALCRPDAKQARVYLRDAQSLPPLAPMVDRVNLSERLMFIESTSQVADKGLQHWAKMMALAGDGSTKPFRGILGKMAGAIIDWDIVAKNGNYWYDRLAVAMKTKDYAGRNRALAKIDRDLEKLAENSKSRSILAVLSGNGEAISRTTGDILISMLLPAISACQRASDRFEQSERHVVLAAALHVYRSEKGHYPEKLSLLSPSILKQVPNDLFTEADVIYQARPRGYLLYSVGPNGKDDGGKQQDEGPGTDDLRLQVGQ